MNLRFCILLILLTFSFSAAVAMDFDTAFKPKQKSQILASCLLESDPFAMDEPISGPYGLSHPFQTAPKLGDAILDAFRAAPPRYALLQYNFADGKINLRSELNFVAGYDHRFEEGESYGFIWKGMKIKNKINRHFYANALWWNGMYVGNRLAAESLSPIINGYYTHTSTQTRVDKLTAELRYTDSHLNLNLARGRAQIGNNISSSIVLSDQVNDYGQLQAEVQLGDFRLSLLHGALIADSCFSQNKLADQHFVDKYLALHELSWRPTKELKLFAGELIIYGNRALDINYLLPHTFWRVIEHNQHDRDNVLIYAGAEAQMSRRLSYWCTAAIDEMSYDKLFSSWWGNKWAVQSGFAYQHSAKSKAAIELVAVRPWTYTHYQNQTMYSHDGRPLGFSDGANLVKMSLELSLALQKQLSWVGRASWMRQGSEGSSWMLNYQDYFTPANVETAQTKWFAGEQEDSFDIDNILNIGPFAHHKLYLGHSCKNSSKPEHKFFAGWQFWY